MHGNTRDQIIRQFGELWWAEQRQTFFRGTFLGVPCFQMPFDAQICQEIISETRPEVVVECGSFAGGSALMWASILQALGGGTVVAVDVEDRMHMAREVPLWDHVEFVHGSSVDPEVVARVTALCAGMRTMVLLDSDHSEEHVAAEIEAYAGLVSSGCYLVVQDGLASAIEPGHGPGPLEATRAFLAVDDRFKVDRDRERLLFTFNPEGYLLRV